VTDVTEVATSPLLAWYEDRRSSYPWRETGDAYAVLVSEVMLQQTQAPRVVPHFERFLARFPDVRALAAARRADVIRGWDGLGYNRRAVSLSEAARAIVRDHGGEVPRDVETLRTLPGVGPYTAAAVAAIAFGVPVAAIDTNVRRVVSRVHAGVDASALRSEDIERLAAAWLDRGSPGDHNQAVMDLGRERCRPVPRCDGCPLASACAFVSAGTAPTPSAARGPRAAGRRAGEPFEGSSRQLRGAVVHELRVSPMSLASLASRTGCDVERVHGAIVGLVRDGVVAAGPGALAARPRGLVRLAS
jgi:A/G-specific adenine glycosylase